MEQAISNVRVDEITSSKYVKPVRMSYTQNGKETSRDFVVGLDAVFCLLFNKETKHFTFVKQFRAPVFYSSMGQVEHTNSHISPGFIVELCAGICDKNQLTNVQICKEEIEEETGYHVSEQQIEHISTFYRTPARSQAKSFLYYCEVDNFMKKSKGGGLEEEGEFIELVHVHMADIHKFLTVQQDVVLLFAVNWWLVHKQTLHQM